MSDFLFKVFNTPLPNIIIHSRVFYFYSNCRQMFNTPFVLCQIVHFQSSGDRKVQKWNLSVEVKDRLQYSPTNIFVYSSRYHLQKTIILILFVRLLCFQAPSFFSFQSLSQSEQWFRLMSVPLFFWFSFMSISHWFCLVVCVLLKSCCML